MDFLWNRTEKLEGSEKGLSTISSRVGQLIGGIGDILSIGNILEATASILEDEDAEKELEEELARHGNPRPVNGDSDKFPTETQPSEPSETKTLGNADVQSLHNETTGNQPNLTQEEAEGRTQEENDNAKNDSIEAVIQNPYAPSPYKYWETQDSKEQTIEEKALDKLLILDDSDSIHGAETKWSPLPPFMETIKEEDSISQVSINLQREVVQKQVSPEPACVDNTSDPLEPVPSPDTQSQDQESSNSSSSPPSEPEEMIAAAPSLELPSGSEVTMQGDSEGQEKEEEEKEEEEEEAPSQEQELSIESEAPCLEAAGEATEEDLQSSSAGSPSATAEEEENQEEEKQQEEDGPPSPSNVPATPENSPSERDAPEFSAVNQAEVEEEEEEEHEEDMHCDHTDDSCDETLDDEDTPTPKPSAAEAGAEAESPDTTSTGTGISKKQGRYNTVCYRKIRKGNTQDRIRKFELMNK